MGLIMKEGLQFYFGIILIVLESVINRTLIVCLL